MVSYYDKILVGMAASLIAGAILGAVTTVAFQSGIVIGSLVATLCLYDALFRHPPTTPTDPRVATTAIVWHGFVLTLAVVAYAG